MSNNTKYVRDAFKSLELVEDKEFDLFGDDSFEELDDYIKDEEEAETEQEVIDLEAENEEELKDSYVGDAILSCPVCRTNLFKPMDDVIVDDETKLCCAGEACPVCAQEDGFKVIGKVAPFEEVEEEEETEVEVETEPEEAEVEVKEKVRESFKKRVADKRLQEKRIPAHRKLMEKVCKDCGKEVCECDKEEKPAKKPIRIKATGNMVEIPIEKKDRPLKEEKGDLNKLDKDIQDIVGDHFGYTMNFDFLDIVADVLLRVDDFENEDLWETVDSTLIYADDQWEVLEHYVDSPADLSDGSWDDAFAQFVGDLEEICRKVAAQRGGEEVSESKKSSNKGKKLKEGKKLVEDEEKVIVHELPDDSYGQDYWYWYIDDDGLYGKDGKNGLIILDDRGRIYKQWTQFSDNQLLDAISENSLSELIGKEYDNFNSGDFECYYPESEFSIDWLSELADIAEGQFTVYKVLDADEKGYNTLIADTVITTWNGPGTEEEQIAKTLGVSPDQIVIKKPKHTWTWESKKSNKGKKLSESKYQIKEVSSDEAGDIINNRKPLGLFLQKDGNTFVAIDNSTGDAWTEEFKNRRSAEKWLLSADESLKKPTKGKKLSEAVSDYAKEDTLTWEDLRNNEFVYSLGDLDNEWKYIKFFEGSNDIYEDDVPEGEDPDDYSLVYYEIYDGDKQEVDGGEMIAPLSKTFVTKDLIKDLLELSGLTIEDDSEFTVTKMDSDFLDEALKSSKNKKLTEAPVYDLHPQFDSRKSFYSKAKVDTGYKGDKNKLYSYGTLVAELEDGKPVVYGTFSSTTLRHIKDWLKQLGFKADNAKQIMADYGVKDENRSVRRPGRKVNESLEDIKSEWENMKRENIFEFPSGDYVYVGIDFDKKTIYAGGATNTGIFRETEIDLDEDDSLYGNLERLYDTISEEHPEYFETDESLNEDALTERKSDFSYLTHSEKLQYVIDNFKKITGRNIKGVFNRGAESDEFIFNQDFIDATYDKIDSFLKKNGMSNKEVEDFIYDLDAELVNIAPQYIGESLNEDIEKATIETEDQVIKVSSEPKDENMNADWQAEGGELLDDVSGDEMIAPLDDTDINEIEANSEEKETAEEPVEEPAEETEEETEEETTPEDEEEFDFDEIQEESFKRITESYLKKVYSNVKSFKINSAELKESLLTINGTIEFNSGKTKDTSFVFESKNDKTTIAKSKRRFVGLNETITDKKNAYVLSTSLQGKKLVAESLRYDYPAKTSNLTEGVKTVKGFIK